MRNGEFSTIVRFAALLSIAFGIAQCFFGYRLYRILVMMTGFFLGFGAGAGLAMVADSREVGLVLAGLLGGILGALLLWELYLVSVFMLGALAGGLLGFALTASMDYEGALLVAIVVLGLAGGIAALYLQKFVIIISTAIVGATNIIYGVGLVLTPRLDLRDLSRAWRDFAGGFEIAPLLWIVLIIAGIWVQYRGPGPAVARAERPKDTGGITAPKEPPFVAATARDVVRPGVVPAQHVAAAGIPPYPKDAPPRAQEGVSRGSPAGASSASAASPGLRTTPAATATPSARATAAPTYAPPRSVAPPRRAMPQVGHPGPGSPRVFAWPGDPRTPARPSQATASSEKSPTSGNVPPTSAPAPSPPPTSQASATPLDRDAHGGAVGSWLWPGGR